MTVAAIHRITGIPEEILAAGIRVLEAPDHGSRTPDMEGRRIARLDEHREWGWFLVNFEKYRKQVSREDKKETDRQRIAEKRAAEKGKENNSVATCREESLHVADVAHTDTDTDTEKNKETVILLAEDAVAERNTISRFAEFWALYPNKAARKPAEDKWRSRCLDSKADEIIADVRRKMAGDDKWLNGFVPNATTYINQDRWLDPVQPRRAPQRHESPSDGPSPAAMRRLRS